MKIWKDANEVIKMVHEVPEDLKEFEAEMQKKPNFDHSSQEGKKVKKKKKTRTIKYK